MSTNKPTVWLLSAYRSESHAAWTDWLVNTLTEFNWCKLELPGRHFRWRIRGNPLSWLHKLPKEKPDLILATSMVDLATLKGLHPGIATTPTIYYFHENQFAYPTSEQQHASVDPQMVQLYGALAADKLVFNSNYNKNSFITGVDTLLKKLPDEVPDNICENLEKKCQVLPVPIKSLKNQTLSHASEKNPELILWNHRWEYDKAPEVFADTLIKLDDKKIDFQLALLGERAKKTPKPLQEINDRLNSKILVNRKVSKDEYNQVLAQASIVVSTAIHEFEGLAILEAVSAGAAPLVPDDLCYQEQYPEEFRYPAKDSNALANKLEHFLKNTPAAPDVSEWDEIHLMNLWQKLLLG